MILDVRQPDPLTADLSENQSQRLAALLSCNILDTPRAGPFDDVVKLATHVCQAPFAFIHLFDESRPWSKAEIGVRVCATPLNTSIPADAILQSGLLR